MTTIIKTKKVTTTPKKKAPAKKAAKPKSKSEQKRVKALTERERFLAAPITNDTWNEPHPLSFRQLRDANEKALSEWDAATQDTKAADPLPETSEPIPYGLAVKVAAGVTALALLIWGVAQL